MENSEAREDGETTPWKWSESKCQRPKGTSVFSRNNLSSLKSLRFRSCYNVAFCCEDSFYFTEKLFVILNRESQQTSGLAVGFACRANTSEFLVTNNPGKYTLETCSLWEAKEAC